MEIEHTDYLVSDTNTWIDRTLPIFANVYHKPGEPVEYGVPFQTKEGADKMLRSVRQSGNGYHAYRLNVYLK